MKNGRNSSFELLRLLCISGILVMHVFAGVEEGNAANMAVHVFANSLFNTGVTCFILISGYFGIRFDLQKLIRLDMMVIFFTVLGTLSLGESGVKPLVKACIPVLSRQYWFITCYFALCFLAPYLNRLPGALTKEAFGGLLLTLLFLFSIIPTFTTYDIMQDAGKGLVHFVMVYLIGRYLARYHDKPHRKGRLAAGILASTLCVFAADTALTLKNGVIYSTFSRDCSFFILFTAVLVFLLFREMRFQSRAINYMAGSVLAVYVLDRYVRAFLDRFVDLNAYAGEWYLIFAVLAYVAALLLSAIALDSVRRSTVGRLEPWISGIAASALLKAAGLFKQLLKKICAFFLAA